MIFNTVYSGKCVAKFRTNIILPSSWLKLLGPSFDTEVVRFRLQGVLLSRSNHIALKLDLNILTLNIEAAFQLETYISTYNTTKLNHFEIYKMKSYKFVFMYLFRHFYLCVHTELK